MSPIEPARAKTAEVEKFSGWGNHPVLPAKLQRPERRKGLRPVGASSLARGQGRSYGDAALNSLGTLVLTERLDRLLGFDPKTGDLTAEAGATLEDLIEALLPHGWFLPVTPGTRFCSLGGCLAADVHGKNHHVEGSFSAHVRSFELVRADGGTAWVTPQEDPGLFWATAGGMGLTGMVSTLTLRMKKVETSWMSVTHSPARSLDELFDLLDDPAHAAEYSVAWIDGMASGSGLGRGVLMSGEHAAPDQVPSGRAALEWCPKRNKALPFPLPSWALHPWAVRLGNSVYYWAQGRRGRFVCPIEPYFYPLDSIQHWNRMYGRRGFLQYQFVAPPETARATVRTVVQSLADGGYGSFLGVLKKFGPQGEGMLSFPMSGLTLALDVPMRHGIEAVLDRMDEVVADAGGRVYLAKDARLARAAFERMYPRLEEFRQVREACDPSSRLGSDLARRLGLA